MAELLPRMKASQVAILFALLAVLASLVSIPPALAWDNVLQNPGFEEGTTGWLEHGGLLTYMNNPAHSGSLAAFFIASEAEGWIYQTVPVSAGASYAFSGWAVKNSINDAAVFLQIFWYESEDGSGNEIRYDPSANLNSNAPEYRFVTTGIQIAPTNAHSATVKGIVRLGDSREPASIWFDDMSFIKLPPTPSPTPSQTCCPNLLLTNPGFEEGTISWSNYSGNLALVETPVHGDNFAAAFTSETASTKWIYQVISIQERGAYTFCGYTLKNDINIEMIFLRISWYASEDGFGSEISHNDSLTALIDDQPQYRLLTTGEVTAPADARSAKVKAILAPASDAIATACFDSMSFTGPPPSTPTSTPSPSPTVTPSPSPSPTTTPTPSPTPAGTTANEGDIMINEVQYDPPQSGPDASFEWVELFNRTTEPIDLRGWRIRDNGESDSIPPLLLPANGFAVIAATEEGFYENFSDFDGSIVFLHGSMGNGLSNDGDCIILEDSEGGVIDAISYGDDDTMMSPPCPSVDVGHSLERSPPGGGFSDNPHPTPGYSLSPIPTPAPTETPVETQTPTIPPTETPTASPPSGATTESSGGSGFSGIALRGVGIALAIVIFGILFWVTRRKGSQK